MKSLFKGRFNDKKIHIHIDEDGFIPEFNCGTRKDYTSPKKTKFYIMLTSPSKASDLCLDICNAAYWWKGPHSGPYHRRLHIIIASLKTRNWAKVHERGWVIDHRDNDTSNNCADNLFAIPNTVNSKLDWNRRGSLEQQCKAYGTRHGVKDPNVSEYRDIIRGFAKDLVQSGSAPKGLLEGPKALEAHRQGRTSQVSHRMLCDSWGFRTGRIIHRLRSRRDYTDSAIDQ